MATNKNTHMKKDPDSSHLDRMYAYIEENRTTRMAELNSGKWREWDLASSWNKRLKGLVGDNALISALVPLSPYLRDFVGGPGLSLTAISNWKSSASPVSVKLLLFIVSL